MKINKVHLINGHDLSDFEDEINEFIKSLNNTLLDVIDIKFSTIVDNTEATDMIYYSAMIILK